MQRGGIILCGGRSSRMGLPKLLLPFGPETMLQRVVRLLSQACDVLVVVGAQGQALPPLPTEVLVTQDRYPEHGPLEGLAAGLRILPPTVLAAYVTSCDAPLLVPAFVTRMFDLLGDHCVAVPHCDGAVHPLAAVYQSSLLGVVEELRAARRFGPSRLFDIVATRRVEANEFVDVDPNRDSLKNLNHPADYLAALKLAGLPVSQDVIDQLTAAASE